MGRSGSLEQGKMIQVMIRPAATRRAIWRALLALLAHGVLLLALSSGPADAATTFTVNKSSDAKDRRISDSVCDTSRKKGKQCTLRAAIQESNDTSGADTIKFNIDGTASVKTIKPASPLPTIKKTVTINGYSQLGASENTLAEGNDAVLKIVLNGIDAGSANGLVIQAPNSTVSGLVINRFAGNGVLLSGSGATGNRVEGNFIGTNAAGNADVGNGDDGVDVFGPDDNTIGGTAASARNVISGNSGDGVQIVGGLGTTGNEILGNYIGTDKNGSNALGNSEKGVLIFGVSDNTVGGTEAGARNVISGNDQDGIQISGNASVGIATGNKVLGNFIGTNVTGNAGLGNSGDGVDISNAEDSTIGGTVTAARNIISGNGGDGVVLFGTDATGNKVQGNFIGTGANGTTPLGNDDGVAISSASDSTIGSTAGGNRIANNDQDGVLVFGGAAVGNSILSNSIFSNGETGIDLGGGLEDSFGVTANDDGDPDAPNSNNRRQNFPVIATATRSNTTNLTTISGALNSNPSQDYTIQCFVAAPDPSGHGEGQILVAQTTASTNAAGNVNFSCVTSFPLVVGQTVTATATNTTTDDTSEFSQNVGVIPGP